MYELKIKFPYWLDQNELTPIVIQTYDTLEEAYNASYAVKKVLNNHVKVSIKPVKDTEVLKSKILADFFKGDKR